MRIDVLYRWQGKCAGPHKIERTNENVRNHFSWVSNARYCKFWVYNFFSYYDQITINEFFVYFSGILLKDHQCKHRIIEQIFIPYNLLYSISCYNLPDIKIKCTYVWKCICEYSGLYWLKDANTNHRQQSPNIKLALEN